MPRSGGIADKILFCEHHLVTFCRVNSRIEPEHVHNSADKNCEILLLVATIVKWQNGGALCMEFDRSKPFRCRRLNESVQRLTMLVSVLA